LIKNRILLSFSFLLSTSLCVKKKERCAMKWNSHY
jgi:hypothetical protein